jgi:hypothetical protein
MEIKIDYDNPQLTSKYEDYDGEYNGVSFVINAHWNDWDEWEVDFDQEGATSAITEEFLNNMF